MATMTAITMLAGAMWMAIPDQVVERFGERSVTYTGGEYTDHVFKFRVLPPEKIEEGKRYPVVLFLHGAGERGADNVINLMHFPTWMSAPEQRAKYPCWLIVPQCPDGKMWIDAHWSRKTHVMTPEPNDEMKMAIAAWQSVMKAEADHVDADRVYLTGLSMGGYGSWDLACRHPEWFAAVAPICGGGDVKQAAKLVGLPVWAWHGDADNAVPVERSRSMIAAIKAAGGEPKYTELAGVGHNSWTPAYEGDGGLMPWMFQQVRKKAQ